MDAEQLILSFVGVNMVSNVIGNIGRDMANFMTQVENHSSNFGRAMMKMGSAAVVAGGLIAGMGTVALVTLFKQAESMAGTAKAANDMAVTFGGTFEGTQRMIKGAQMVGVSQDELTAKLEFSTRQRGQLALADEIAIKNSRTLSGVHSDQSAKIATLNQQIAITEQKLANAGVNHTLVGKAVTTHNIQVESLNLTLQKQQAELAKLEGGTGKLIAGHTKLKDATSLYLQALGDMGITATKANDNLHNQNEVMLEVADAITKIHDPMQKLELLQKIYGRSVGPEFVAFLEQGRTKIEETQKSITGIIPASAQEPLKEFYTNTKEMHDQLDALKITIITSFVPVLNSLIQAVMPIIKSMIEWAKAHPELVKLILIAATVGLIFVGVIVAIAGVVMILTGLLAALPFLAIAAGITFVVAAFIVFRKQIGDTISAFVNALGAIKDTVNAWGGMIGNALFNAGVSLITGLIVGIGSAIPKLKATITAIPGNILNWFKDRANIHSPSLLFAQEVGVPIMHGIAMGMGAGLPAVREAGGLMTPANVMQGGGNVTNNNRSVGPITVNLYGIAGSAGDIGAAVRKELAAHFG